MTSEELTSIKQTAADMEVVANFLGMKGRFESDMLRISISDLANAIHKHTSTALQNQNDDWRPIETAPTDGTWVLLFGGETTENIYVEESHSKKRPVVAFYNNDQAAWNFCFWDSTWRECYDNPTHWKPLQPPKKERKQ